jgi:hypothetical protein
VSSSLPSWGRRLRVPVLRQTTFLALLGSFIVGQACARSRDQRGCQSGGSGLRRGCACVSFVDVLRCWFWLLGWNFLRPLLGCGLGIGVDAGAAAPDFGVVLLVWPSSTSLGVGTGCLGGIAFGLVGTQSWDRCVCVAEVRMSERQLRK